MILAHMLLKRISRRFNSNRNSPKVCVKFHKETASLFSTVQKGATELKLCTTPEDDLCEGLKKATADENIEKENTIILDDRCFI